MPKTRRTPLQRFMGKAEPEPNTGCWLWTGALSRGYGRFWSGGRTGHAHRFAYGQSVGPIPDGSCVLHRCDVPACVNPGHLFLGTVGDNNADRMAKGRTARQRGECSGSAKLAAEDVRSIRARYANGETQDALGRAFGVGQTNISRIVRRGSWAHI